MYAKKGTLNYIYTYIYIYICTLLIDMVREELFSLLISCLLIFFLFIHLFISDPVVIEWLYTPVSGAWEAQLESQTKSDLCKTDHSNFDLSFLFGGRWVNYESWNC